MIRILTTQSDLQARFAPLQRQRKIIGLVPTMGALHDGHLTLARTALAQCDECVVSIFVNPKQFAPHEDFDRYPRPLERDIELLDSIGVQSVFTPSPEVMYPPGFQTTITVGNVSKPLEGEFRPHFFAGVATVVARLLLLTGADKAYFGEKDYQQLQVVRAMVHDLAIPTEIVGVPTIREESGLAMSSRNAYLTAEKRKEALCLSQTLFSMAAQLKAGRKISEIESQAALTLLSSGFDKIDYIAICDAATLEPPAPQTTALRILGAAWIGNVRLIDNIAV